MDKKDPNLISQSSDGGKLSPELKEIAFQELGETDEVSEKIILT